MAEQLVLYSLLARGHTGRSDTVRAKRASGREEREGDDDASRSVQGATINSLLAAAEHLDWGPG